MHPHRRSTPPRSSSLGLLQRSARLFPLPRHAQLRHRQQIEHFVGGAPMNWIVAGLIAGVGAFFADNVMWGKVFTGPEMHGFGTMPPTPEAQKKLMASNMPKSAALALVFGLLLACSYQRLKGGLWVQGGGPLAGMEFATLLWLCTIALSTLGSGVWYDKVRPLLKATFWSWLVRMNVAGLIVGLLVR